MEGQAGFILSRTALDELSLPILAGFPLLDISPRLNLELGDLAVAQYGELYRAAVLCGDALLDGCDHFAGHALLVDRHDFIALVQADFGGGRTFHDVTHFGDGALVIVETEPGLVVTRDGRRRG